MANRINNLKKIILLAGDLLILYLSLAITLIIRYGWSPLDVRFENHLQPFSLIFLAWLLIFYLNDLYRYKIFKGVGLLFKNLALAVFISAGVSIAAFYLFSGFFELTPKTNLFIFSVTFFALDYLFRNAAIKTFSSGATNIIILGNSPLLEETVNYLNDNPQNGYRIAEWFKNPKAVTFDKLATAIAKENVGMVIVPPDLTKDFRGVKLIYKLLPLEVGLINFWNFYEVIFEKVPLDELEENWFVENIATRRRFYDAAKRIADIFLAVALSLIFLLPAVLISLLIKISSKGPIVYAQKRVGKNGRLFTLYKFRTMRNGNNGPLWTEMQDNRVTKAGKFLRFTHLDELPQLVNIIKNDISFIGPRPERTELAEKYRKFSYYEIRHIVKPGLTGWAQINYKPSASLEEAQEKLRYDIYYIKNRSFFLDLLIVLKTIKYLFISHYGG